MATLPRHLRAPQEHGAILAVPPLAEAEALLAANRRQLAAATGQLLGRSWTDLRGQARQVAVAAANAYLRQAGEQVPSFGDSSLLMAGHQPELFHPGVWIKNFALFGLARATNATPVNLIVDNDTAKATSLRLPALAGDINHSRETAGPHVVSLPYDQWTGEVPYEERRVRDEDLFASLPQRAAPFIKPWGFVPLLGAFWSEVRRQALRTPLLGERLVAARRAWERRWGCHNLELQVSQLCRTEPFAWFGCHVLAELPRFHATYNGCLQVYRQRYGIRSRNHPVPELGREGDWLETPFWGWRASQPERGRLLVRRTEHGLALRVGGEIWPELPAGTNADAAALVRAWLTLEGRGFKIRSRALTNTLFARLFLVDLFIHGIGGGRYDELTDEIARRFYGCEPPRYLILSATLLLPFPGYPGRHAERQRLARELRDLHYNPQRHLREAATVPALAAEKQAWIAQQPTSSTARRERFQVLRELTDKLRPDVVHGLRTLEEDLERCDRELQANAVLQRRDYAFCLYPEEMLRDFCAQFL